MAETTTTPPRRRDHVEPAPLSEYELHRNERIAANQAFLETLGLGGTGQKLPKKPARAKPKKRKREDDDAPPPGERRGNDLSPLFDAVVRAAVFARLRARRRDPRGPASMSAPAVFRAEDAEALAEGWPHVRALRTSGSKKPAAATKPAPKKRAAKKPSAAKKRRTSPRSLSK